MAKTKRVYLKTSDLDKIISKNRDSLKAGSSITRDEFIEMFGVTGVTATNKTRSTYQSLHSQHLKLVAIQRRVNKILRCSGLTMRSKNYGSTFYVCDKEQTKAAIVRHAAMVDRHTYCEELLEANLDRRLTAGTWGKPTRTIGTAAANAIIKPVPGSRAAIVAGRVQKYK